MECPGDFKNAEHGLKKLFVTTLNGVIFASYSADMEPIEEYLGPEIKKDFDVVFSGRKPKILGYYKNELPCNWKMYHENLKDPYHATPAALLPRGVWPAGGGQRRRDDRRRAAWPPRCTMASAKKEDKYAAVSEENKKEMRSFHEGMRLKDERFLDFIKEFDSPWSVTMQTIWPNMWWCSVR